MTTPTGPHVLHLIIRQPSAGGATIANTLGGSLGGSQVLATNFPSINSGAYAFSYVILTTPDGVNWLAK